MPIRLKLLEGPFGLVAERFPVGDECTRPSPVTIIEVIWKETASNPFPIRINHLIDPSECSGTEFRGPFGD